MAKPKQGDICVFYNEEFKLPYTIGILSHTKNKFYFCSTKQEPFNHCVLLSEFNFESLNDKNIILDPYKEFSNDEIRYLQKLDKHLMKKHSIASLNGDLSKIISYKLGRTIFYQNAATMMNIRMFLYKTNTKPSDWKIHTRTI